jgi:hypothetical protein
LTITTLVAKAGKVRSDGKAFSATVLKRFAQESPDKYEYLEGPQELWLKSKEKKQPNANFS